MLPAEVPAADITPGEVETVNGASVTLAVGSDGSVTVNDAKVVTADVEADNGVIHVIDKVLLPPDASPGSQGCPRAAAEMGTHPLAVVLTNTSCRLGDVGPAQGYAWLSA